MEDEPIVPTVPFKECPIRWTLAKKGDDGLPLLMSITNFGSKWYAGEVFEDRRPRIAMGLLPNFHSGR